jgi:hypothetical protein
MKTEDLKLTMDQMAVKNYAWDTAVEEEERKHLNETQSMRVVALNEAVNFFKSAIEHRPNVFVSTDEITKMAKHFSKFLIDGEWK